MATFDSFNDDEDENQNGQSQNGEQVLAGQSSNMSQNQSGGAQQQAQTPQTKSGSWTNLMDYVGANQGNDAKMGESISSNIQTRANDANASGDQFKSDVNQKVNEGSVQDNGLSDAVKSNPNEVAKTRKNEFDKAWDAYYQGPNQASDVEGYGLAGQKYQDVQSRAQNAQTHSGRQQLLEDQYARPTYSAGEKNLDSYILGAGQQGRQALTDINQNYGNFSSGWDTLLNDVTGNIAQGKATTDQTRENLRNTVNSEMGRYDTNFAGKQAQLEKEYASNADKLARIQSKLNEKGSAIFDDIGLDADIGNYLLPMAGKNAMQNVIKAGDARKFGDLVSDDEIANYQALLDLGRQAQGNYTDFSRTGAKGDSIQLNSRLIDTAKKAKDMQSAAEKQAALEQADRQAQYDRIMRSIGSYAPDRMANDGFYRTGMKEDSMAEAEAARNAKIGGVDPTIGMGRLEETNFGALGVTEKDIKDAYAKGINPLEYLKQNRALNATDIINKTGKLSAWHDLYDSLQGYGFNPNIDRNDDEEGDAYSFNTDKFLKALKG